MNGEVVCWEGWSVSGDRFEVYAVERWWNGNKCQLNSATVLEMVAIGSTGGMSSWPPLRIMIQPTVGKVFPSIA